MASGEAFEASDALIVAEIVARRIDRGRPVAIGLCGAQGSGKSTTAARLAQRLEAMGLRVAPLSIDDFYLTKAQRDALARTVHPLFATRGVPGTHDVALARHIIDRLLDPALAEGISLPLFDKTSDDRLPADETAPRKGPVDVILLEGWCVGARPEPREALDAAINELEALEDFAGKWRAHVNQALDREYRDLFALLDFSIMLRAPDFGRVYEWRAEQEQSLTRVAGISAPPMSESALRRFIAHYERLTRWLMADEPADLVIDLDENRVPRDWRDGSFRRET